MILYLEQHLIENAS